MDALGNLIQVTEPNPQYGQADSSSTNFQTTYTYDVEGHLTKVQMPCLGGSGTVTQTRTFNYNLTTGLLTSVTNPENGTVSYSYYPSGRVLSKIDAKNEKVVYSYDGYGRVAYIDRYAHLTGVNLTYLTYTYPTSPANAGRISQAKNVASGEQIAYTYDALNRLSQASAAGWGQSFAYDGFGNLTGKTATAGSAPYMSLSVDPTTNRTTTSGFQYDANGNLTNLPNVSGALSYDIENRTGSTNSLYSNLAYDMENQPLDRGGQWNLYGLNGERLGTYTYTFGRNVTYINGVDYDTTPVYPAQASRNIYFGGRLIQSNNTTVVVDAQGSVRANESGQTFEFYPYGEEMGSGTTNGREKFATYTRESNGLDYADQRYYSSTYGAFTSADPLHQTATTPADPNNPGSWNRFAYTAADPINRIDPLGTSNCAVDSFDSGDSDDSDVNLGSNCGSGFEPGGDLPSGATRCHALPGVIFTFNGVPSTCQDGIIVDVDDQHVAAPDPSCSISLFSRGVPFSRSPANHTYIQIIDPATNTDDILEGGPTNRHNPFTHPFAPWGSLAGIISGTNGATQGQPLRGDNILTNALDGAEIGGADVCTEAMSLLTGVQVYNSLGNNRPAYAPLPNGKATFNSNSFTWTLLNQIGLAFGAPGWSPGWGYNVPGL